MRATNKALASGDIPFITHFFNNIISSERKFDQFSQFCPDGLTSELFLSNMGKYPFSCDYNQGQLRLRGLHLINIVVCIIQRLSFLLHVLEMVN